MGKKTIASDSSLSNLNLECENLLGTLLQKEIKHLADKLGLDALELKAFLDHDNLSPKKIKICLLRSAFEHDLDPLKYEILINRNEDQSWQIQISVDGWAKILNSHPAFRGIEFSYSNELIDNIPVWIECTIHRVDRIAPITVREYFLETRRNQQIWIEMPRRMLRHRALQQCMRLAFGIDVNHHFNTVNASDTTSIPKLKLQNCNESNEPKTETSSRVNFLKTNLKNQVRVNLQGK